MNEHYTPVSEETLFTYLNSTRGITREEFDETLESMEEYGILRRHPDGGFVIPQDVWTATGAFAKTDNPDKLINVLEGRGVDA